MDCEHLWVHSSFGRLIYVLVKRQSLLRLRIAKHSKCVRCREFEIGPGAWEEVSLR